MPPDAEATIVLTIGSSHRAVKPSSFESWTDMITNGKNMHVATATTTSIHQSTHASWAAQLPNAGMQTKAVIFTMVARPMGTLPRKSDWTGWYSMAVKMPG